MTIAYEILLKITIVCSGSGSHFEVNSRLEAPPRYYHVVPRIQLPVNQLFENLFYEGNNIVMRGDRTSSGDFSDTGETVSLRWRHVAASCRGIFVLRDSLFSQQDHPYRHESHALMLPPSWITAAATIIQEGDSLHPMIVFEIENDHGWTQLPSADALFGSFPRSDTLFGLATSSLRHATPALARQITNARIALRSLAKDTQTLIDASHLGPEVIMRIGAERISLSDCKYFGREVRRKHIIPIFVENPSLKEQSEGKGLLPPGRWIDPKIANKATQIIYRRRLRDGDLAIERYDLSLPSERLRAIDLLESLIPIGEDLSTTVWLWVTGPLDDSGKLSGQNAIPWIAEFREELSRSIVDGRRIVLLSKPCISLPSGLQRKAAFEAQVDLFKQQQLPLSINLSTHAILPLLDLQPNTIAAGQ